MILRTVGEFAGRLIGNRDAPLGARIIAAGERQKGPVSCQRLGQGTRRSAPPRRADHLREARSGQNSAAGTDRLHPPGTSLQTRPGCTQRPTRLMRDHELDRIDL
jgi:hypothetical protein